MLEGVVSHNTVKTEIRFGTGRKHYGKRRQEDHDGPISLT